ncbi:tetratricopeptide repeat protein [Phycisphaeraceae bacterium D3-23]
MSPRTPNLYPHPRRALGKSWAVVVVALVVVGVVGTTTFILLSRTADYNPPPPDADPVAEIIALQEDFKRYMENQLDMIDLLPAVKAYTKRYPDRDAGYILLAQVLMKMELYSEAYPALDRALAGNADNFELRKLTGTCAAKLGLWDEAEVHLLAADALKEDDETVVLQLANLYFQTGRLDEAFARYEDAKKLSGSTPPHKANAGLAEVYAARGDYENALKKIALAIKWADGDSQAELWVYQLSMVRMLFDDGQWERGESLLDTTQGDNADLVLRLPFARLRARLQAHQGKPGLAAGELAIIANPAFAPEGQTDREKADILAEYAYWCLVAGDTAQAQEPLDALRGLMPEHPRLAELEARAAAAP